MIIHHDSDAWVTEIESTMLPCPYCNGKIGCKHAYGHSSYSQRRATPEEYKANKARRLKEEIPIAEKELAKMKRELERIEDA